MRLIQCDHQGQVRAALVESEEQVRLLDCDTYTLANRAISAGKPLSDMLTEALTDTRLDYQALVDAKQLLPPLTHTDPAHCLVTGTGLTHLGSADTRSAMHAKAQAAEEDMTDSMRMFKLGVEGGKPDAGQLGAQPEWFYKGDGQCVVAPEAEIPSPAFAEDAGEEPELAGLYVIGDDGQPWRVGYAIGNEFSDHVTERFNYLWLAHSKLRACSFGPELLIGELPENLEGTSRIQRSGETLWEKPFLTGEANMAHSLANLEYHHFKYPGFRRPGDVHVHFFGTATLSFADGIKVREGDRFEIKINEFGRALRNPLRLETDARAISVKSL
ncbi:FAH family protein [Halomonas sp. FeN2]|uniref:AraD1 family protein n=1 Tax=Halomonadaceae TaxID=28256 RepID=UPI000C3F0DEE|nr:MULTISPECIES: AraD1 family protein [unclassified Halomonas]MBF58143.1 FAH family protein [Halomonas sp.]UBR51304.1 FAH family protein [Halomonas sp. FeN2]|tara:strand:- start:5620 stop:6606 length:987 start_codon:yes stop_codon:yes gene_type:complete